MILKLEIILSDVSYERKKITFSGKKLKLTNSDTFNNVFYNRISPILKELFTITIFQDF